MATAAPPFKQGSDHSHDGDISSCPVFRMLPQSLQEESTETAHLWDYLHSLPMEEIGIPEYHEVLTRRLGEAKDPNLIYPVGQGIYVHIYPNQRDARQFYISIEPSMGADIAGIMHEAELRLVDFVTDMDEADDSEGRAGALLRSLDKFCQIRDKPGKNARGASGVVKGRKTNKLELSREEMGALRYRIVRDKARMGQLEPLLLDPHIEDISCSGLGNVFIEHKIFKGLTANISFTSMEELDTFVIRLSEKIGKPVTFRDPIVDATLPDGSRINVVYGADLSRRGSNFTIRKFTSTPLSILDIINFGTASYEIAAYLSLCLGHGMNMFVSGETASGKTTLLNALTTFIPPTGKIVSIEDTPEVQLPHPNWIREVVRGSGRNATGSAVTMFDLLKAALRQRPNEIIIGEIRGEEGAIAFQAMQTGHSAMATFHAASVEKLIQRLTGSPINIPKTYIDNLNIVCIQSMVRLPNGKDGRRVISVNEIVGYDSSSDSFSFIEIFRWNPLNDQFEFTGYMNSYLLEEKIALIRGIPPNEKRKIYDELTRRVNVLKRLNERKVTDFYELYVVLSQAYRQGVFR